MTANLLLSYSLCGLCILGGFPRPGAHLRFLNRPPARAFVLIHTALSPYREDFGNYCAFIRGFETEFEMS